MSTIFVLVRFVCSFVFVRFASVLGPEPLNNRGVGRFRHPFPVVSGILTEVTSDKLP
ncbi:hypothetical protein ES703_102500 [subsurface metagenome]